MNAKPKKIIENLSPSSYLTSLYFDFNAFKVFAIATPIIGVITPTINAPKHAKKILHLLLFNSLTTAQGLTDISFSDKEIALSLFSNLISQLEKISFLEEKNIYHL